MDSHVWGACVGGVYRCVGIPRWAGMGTHVWVHTFMNQHMHVEVKEALGGKSHHVGKASWPVNCKECPVSVFHLSSSELRECPGVPGFSCGLWV